MRARTIQETITLALMADVVSTDGPIIFHLALTSHLRWRLLAHQVRLALVLAIDQPVQPHALRVHCTSLPPSYEFTSMPSLLATSPSHRCSLIR